MGQGSGDLANAPASAASAANALAENYRETASLIGPEFNATWAKAMEKMAAIEPNGDWGATADQMYRIFVSDGDEPGEDGGLFIGNGADGDPGQDGGKGGLFWGKGGNGGAGVSGVNNGDAGNGGRGGFFYGDGGQGGKGADADVEGNAVARGRWSRRGQRDLFRCRR